MLRQELLGFLIGTPDRGQAGCFRRHYINTITKIHRKLGQARADKFEYLILDIPACENLANKA